MKWVTNCSREEAKQFISNGMTTGNPKPTEKHNLESLLNMDIIGIYDPEKPLTGPYNLGIEKLREAKGNYEGIADDLL